MKTTHSKFTNHLVILGALSAMPFASANANLIVNGSFEVPLVADGTFHIFKSIPGWTTTSGAGIEIQRNVAGTSFDGIQHVELDSKNNSRMTQTVSTVPGVEYLLSVAYSPRPVSVGAPGGVPLASNRIQVRFNGVLLETLAQDGSGLPDTEFTRFFFTVTPTTNNSVVEFRAVGTNDALGGYLDDVILAPLQ